MKNLIIIYVIVLILAEVALSQTNLRQIDSLETILKKASGYQKIDLTNTICSLYTAKFADVRIQRAMNTLKISIDTKYTKGILEAYNNIGVGYYMIYKIDSSLYYLFKGLSIAEKSNLPLIKATILTNIGNSKERQTDFKTANDYHYKALVIREKEKDSAGIASSLNNIGLNHWRWGNFGDAESYFTKSLAIRKSLKDTEGVGRILNNLGVLQWNWGKYYKALLTYLESLDAREATSDTLGTVVTMNNIAMLYQKLGDSEKAYHYLQNALKKAEIISYNFGIAYSYENLGDYYLSKNDIENAFSCFNNSMKFYSVINFKPGITDINNALGNLYFTKNDFVKAKELFQKAYNEGLSIENKKAVTASLLNLGKIHVKLRNIPLAKKYLYEALDLATKNKMLEFISAANGFLGEAFEFEGDFRKAYSYFKVHKTLDDSLFNVSNTTIINEIKEKYDAEKKERENELLRSKTQLQSTEINRQNSILTFIILAFILSIILLLVLYYFYLNKKKAKEKVESLNQSLTHANEQLQISEKELKELNRTKDKFFSIIAHDLKNPFMALMGYSELLTDDFSNLNDDDKYKMIYDIKEISFNTFKLLENLLYWSRFQIGMIKFNEKEIDVSSLLEENIRSIKHSAQLKEIKIVSDIQKDIIIKADREMLSTVFRNLLSNAIKFTNKNGMVDVKGYQKNGDLEICIQDNGIGIDDSKINQLFSITDISSQVGTNGEKGTGLGLILCNEFVEKHQGKITVESVKNKGTKFVVIIPMKNLETSIN